MRRVDAGRYSGVGEARWVVGTKYVHATISTWEKVYCSGRGRKGGDGSKRSPLEYTPTLRLTSLP
ncbi:hypothetical protein E2C01_102370 [Portunus trituberculatus]|uniref:Uncharacterized protein n=1 Tax=Portunus trituberculatus TaxID=210409 RepID=A0A5B7KI75_PORTR|nr:hypothetical protein [Portunus trituberculatus]